MTKTQTTNGANTMTKQTQVANYIINNIQTALAGCQRPDIMMENILNNAQALVNEEGFVWDVALAKACYIYPKTQYCGLYAYEA
jgi:hypothetical protein